MSRYDDIINLPHHVSKTRTPMSMEARAAQFAPFAALTGHGDAIAETARLTDDRPELSVEELGSLSRRLRYALEKDAAITITYFDPDRLKAGGSFRRIEGRIKKVDEFDGRIVLESKQTIPLRHILGIESEAFRDIDL